MTIDKGAKDTDTSAIKECPAELPLNDSSHSVEAAQELSQTAFAGADRRDIMAALRQAYASHADNKTFSEGSFPKESDLVLVTDSETKKTDDKPGRAAEADAVAKPGQPNDVAADAIQSLDKTLKEMGLNRELIGMLEAIAQSQQENYQPGSPQIKQGADGKLHVALETPEVGKWKAQTVDFKISQALMPDGKTIDPKAFVAQTEDFHGKPLQLAVKTLDERHMNVWVTQPEGLSMPIDTGVPGVNANVKMDKTAFFQLNVKDKHTLAVEGIKGLSLDVMGVPVAIKDLRYGNGAPLGAKFAVPLLGKTKDVDVSLIPAGSDPQKDPMRVQMRLNNGKPVEMRTQFVGKDIKIDIPDFRHKPMTILLELSDDGSLGVHARSGNGKPIDARVREKDGWAMIHVDKINLLGAEQSLDVALTQKEGRTYARFYNLLGQAIDAKFTPTKDKDRVHIDVNQTDGNSVVVPIDQSQSRVFVGSGRLSHSFDVWKNGEKIGSNLSLDADAHFEKFRLRQGLRARRGLPPLTRDWTTHISRPDVSARVGTAGMTATGWKGRGHYDSKPLPAEAQELLKFLFVD